MEVSCYTRRTYLKGDRRYSWPCVTGPQVQLWLIHDAAACLAVRNHLPLVERAHFGKHKTAKALYDVVVTHYSSPATAAPGRLLLPYLFPERSAFATVKDLVTHLRTSNARYRAALPAEFLDRNPPLMYITLYFIVTRLPYSLRAVRDHFLAHDPTDLTVDLLEQHLLAAEVVAAMGVVAGVGALVAAVLVEVGVAVVAAVRVVAVGVELFRGEVLAGA
ncbi:unnamed protein product [Closterium sp. NIES-54]